jgi:hypothetical protein
MDAFAERYLPVEGSTFLSRSGTWLCELKGPVDVSGVDRRILYLHFSLVDADPRWNGPTSRERKLELRTSWMYLVIHGFLDSDELEGMREAYEVERAPKR